MSVRQREQESVDYNRMTSSLRRSWKAVPVLFALCGCRYIAPPVAPSSGAPLSSMIQASNMAPSNVYTNIPDYAYRFGSCQKANPIWWFGNADEPVAPDWYHPNGC